MYRLQHNKNVCLLGGGITEIVGTTVGAEQPTMPGGGIATALSPHLLFLFLFLSDFSE